MRVTIIAPARRGSRTGNRVTAARWTSILKSLGHQVTVMERFRRQPTDLMIALNAYRSAASIRAFRETLPKCPLVVVLGGTDVYHFLESAPEPTMRSIELADQLVAMSSLTGRFLPVQVRKKLSVIYESARPLASGRQPSIRHFNVCVIGHLRTEKDPMRTALAVRNLPEESRIRVSHYGHALGKEWRKIARVESNHNPRYRWLGEVPHWQVRRTLARCQIMVLSSIVEGGPNVLSEAIVAGVPVLSSRIDGSVGVLGAAYPGYFPAEDTERLRRLLLKAEEKPKFIELLTRHICGRSHLFAIEEERHRWKKLIGKLQDRVRRDSIGRP